MLQPVPPQKWLRTQVCQVGLLADHLLEGHGAPSATAAATQLAAPVEDAERGGAGRETHGAGGDHRQLGCQGSARSWIQGAGRGHG